MPSLQERQFPFLCSCQRSNLLTSSYPLDIRYQADVQGFAALGCDKAEAEEKMRLAVELALRAKRDWVESPPFKTSGRLAPAVGLSLGSYGALLLNGEEFTGTFSFGLISFHWRTRLTKPDVLPLSQASTPKTKRRSTTSPTSTSVVCGSSLVSSPRSTLSPLRPSPSPRKSEASDKPCRLSPPKTALWPAFPSTSV